MWPFTKSKADTETKSLSSPQDWLLEMFGSTPTQSGVSVSPESALRVPAVSAAVRAISEAVSTLDIEVVRGNPDGTETPDPSHPILALLRGDANDWTTGPQLIRDLTTDALCDDAGGLAMVNRVGTRVMEIIHPTRGSIFVERDEVTREPTYRPQGQPLGAQNVIHLTAPLGRAPLTLAREAIGTAIVMERHAARLFGRGARPSGALTFPRGMAEEAVKRARAAWAATHEGDNSTGRTAILYDGAEFTPFQLTSTDSQFLENRKFAVEEIARAFRVPPSMLYHLDRATWSNMESMSREFLVFTLEPWLVSLEGALSRALFLPDERGQFRIRFDRDDMSRADLQTRANAINSLIASRVLNPNEGRAWLNQEPYAGGDTYSNPNIEGGSDDAD